MSLRNVIRVEAPRNENRLRRVLLAGLAHQEENVGNPPFSQLWDDGLCAIVNPKRAGRATQRALRDIELDWALKASKNKNSDLEGKILIEWVDGWYRYRQMMDLSPVKIKDKVVGFKIELYRKRVQAGERCMKSRADFVPRHDFEPRKNVGQKFYYKPDFNKGWQTPNSFIKIETISPGAITKANDHIFNENKQVVDDDQRNMLSESYAAITVLPKETNTEDYEMLKENCASRTVTTQSKQREDYLPGVVWFGEVDGDIFTKETVYAAGLMLLDQVYTTDFGVPLEKKMRAPKSGYLYTEVDNGIAGPIEINELTQETHDLLKQRGFDKDDKFTKNEILIDYLKDGMATLYHYEGMQIK